MTKNNPKIFTYFLARKVFVQTLSSWSNNPEAFLEVNLFRTQNFDLCTSNQNLGGTHPSSNCDTKGIYDRRSNYGNGEIVYYDINNMSKVTGYPQSELVVGGSMKSFTIPISQLFRKYSWARPPATWYGVKIKGIYIGHEVWGKGRIWTEFDNYQIYSFVAD